MGKPPELLLTFPPGALRDRATSPLLTSPNGGGHPKPRIKLFILRKRLLGVSSGQVTPLPIPNRVVKLTSADDTRMHVRGKVGRCRAILCEELVQNRRCRLCADLPRMQRTVQAFVRGDTKFIPSWARESVSLGKHVLSESELVEDESRGRPMPGNQKHLLRGGVFVYQCADTGKYRSLRRTRFHPQATRVARNRPMPRYL